MTDQVIPIGGFQVQNAYRAKDEHGYDIVIINFLGGKYLVIREEGQAGHLSILLRDRIG